MVSSVAENSHVLGNRGMGFNLVSAQAHHRTLSSSLVGILGYMSCPSDEDKNYIRVQTLTLVGSCVHIKNSTGRAVNPRREGKFLHLPLQNQ